MAYVVSGVGFSFVSSESWIHEAEFGGESLIHVAKGLNPLKASTSFDLSASMASNLLLKSLTSSIQLCLLEALFDRLESADLRSGVLPCLEKCSRGTIIRDRDLDILDRWIVSRASSVCCLWGLGSDSPS